MSAERIPIPRDELGMEVMIGDQNQSMIGIGRCNAHQSLKQNLI